MSPDRALCLPTFSHLLIVHKLNSLCHSLLSLPPSNLTHQTSNPPASFFKPLLRSLPLPLSPCTSPLSLITNPFPLSLISPCRHRYLQTTPLCHPLESLSKTSKKFWKKLDASSPNINQGHDAGRREIDNRLLNSRFRYAWLSPTRYPSTLGVRIHSC